MSEVPLYMSAFLQFVGGPGCRKEDYFTEMCSGSEAGTYSRLIDLVYHPTLGLRVIKKKRRTRNTLNLIPEPWFEETTLQGYLAHKKQPPPIGPP